MTAQLVPAEDVATELGLPLPLDATVTARINMAVMDSQGKVEGYLNRSLEAWEDTITGLFAASGYPLTDIRAWPQAKGYYDDKYTVKSYVANAKEPSLYDVTFTVGLDVANDSQYTPILTFIRQDAKNTLHNDSLFTAVERKVQSVSADGQSVTYEHHRTFQKPTASGVAQDVTSLRKWKRLAISQGGGKRRFAPWPYAWMNWP